MYFCSKCDRTPVGIGEARLTEKGARKVWNRSVDVAERILSQCNTNKMNNCVKKPDTSYRPNCTDEWLELIHDIGYDYDGCNTVEGLKMLVDEIVDYANKARKCLHEGKYFNKTDTDKMI